MVDGNKQIGGIEAGGTKIVCCLGTDSGQVMERVTFATAEPSVTGPKIVRWFAERKVPDAFGVATFGPVELRAGDDYGRILKSPKAAWQGFSWTELLGKEFSRKVTVATDVEAAGLAEWELGAAQGAGSLVYFTLGTGIGGAYLRDGKFIRGQGHSEMGHFPVPLHANDVDFAGVCPFHRDCFEGRASGTAISSRWGQGGADLGINHPAWEMQAHYLAAGMQTVVAMLAPDKIIFGGGVSQQQGLLSKARTALLQRCNGYFSFLQDTSDVENLVVAAALGQDAGLVGSLLLPSS